VIRGCSVGAGNGVGIRASFHGEIIDNSVTGTSASGTGQGIFVNGPGNRVERNTIRQIGLGIDVNVAGNVILGNRVHDSNTAYDIVAGNAQGPIIDLSAGGVVPNGSVEANLEF
jgi:hypothetical protein